MTVIIIRAKDCRYNVLSLIAWTGCLNFLHRIILHCHPGKLIAAKILSFDHLWASWGLRGRIGPQPSWLVVRLRRLDFNQVYFFSFVWFLSSVNWSFHPYTPVFFFFFSSISVFRTVLQKMLHCHLGCTTWAHVSISNMQFGEHVVPEFAVDCPQVYHDNLLILIPIPTLIHGGVPWTQKLRTPLVGTQGHQRFFLSEQACSSLEYSFACCACWQGFYLASFCLPDSFNFLFSQTCPIPKRGMCHK